MNRIASASVVLALCLTGCSANDVRPPSPAAQLRIQDLLHTPKPPNERYYFMMFGSQSCPRVPRYVHSWATMVKVTDQPDGTQIIEEHTISWMPATLVIHPWRFRVEEGVNLELRFTIEEMLRHKEKIVMWGPYETWHGNFQRFVMQKEFMESGQVGYQCIDALGEAPRDGSGCDCIHAVSDMDPSFARERYALRYFGVSASRNIMKQVLERPILIHPEVTHDWLIPVLGLDCYPLKRRFPTPKADSFTPETMQAYLDSMSAQSSSRRHRIFCR